VELPDAYSWCW